MSWNHWRTKPFGYVPHPDTWDLSTGYITKCTDTNQLYLVFYECNVDNDVLLIEMPTEEMLMLECLRITGKAPCEKRLEVTSNEMSWYLDEPWKELPPAKPLRVNPNWEFDDIPF